jgi:diadenosine tetraphosphate (Ap4A) HIT family hydrolase
VAEFVLDPRIAQSSRLVADLGLSQVRLQDDARFGWLVLVPRREGAVELFDLSKEDQASLLAELDTAASAVRALCDEEGRPVEKLNIANLGNVVPQLHWHVIGRRSDDPCWPGPVWGQPGAIAHEADAFARRVERVRAALLS